MVRQVVPLADTSDAVNTVDHRCQATAMGHAFQQKAQQEQQRANAKAHGPASASAAAGAGGAGGAGGGRAGGRAKYNGQARHSRFSIVGSEQVFCLACPTPATRDRLLSAVTTFCRFASLQRRAEEAEARRQGTV